ncbi:hypothetical protein LCGC14_0960440 [marine sediment metagenome]|uniref:VRR-NUC domain-containing protein n=1 Tax=marine sediment metagenome TaxID=412755 RepID=A0A0F9NEN3_9ZZZZ
MKPKLGKIPEKAIQAAILDYLALRVRPSGGMFWRARPPQYIRAKGSNQGFAIHATEPGMPDIMGCYYGLSVGLEVKTPTGTLRDTQVAFRERYTRAGGHYFIVRSIPDTEKALIKLDDILEKNR